MLTSGREKNACLAYYSALHSRLAIASLISTKIWVEILGFIRSESDRRILKVPIGINAFTALFQMFVAILFYVLSISGKDITKEAYQAILLVRSSFPLLHQLISVGFYCYTVTEFSS